MLEYKRTNGKNKDFIENCRRLDADLDQRVGKEIQRSKYEKYNQLDKINEAIVVYENDVLVGAGSIRYYDEEVEHLETKYGRLYLAYCDDKVAGWIGLRKIDRQNCEMKRLYVRPQFRGNHIGDKLIRIIIEDARQIGYSHMLLDTLPFLKNAIHMYRMYGFYEIESYNDSPMDTSIYMRLDL